jgi:hypothetical protein
VLGSAGEAAADRLESVESARRQQQQQDVLSAAD